MEKPGDVFILDVHTRSGRRRSSPPAPSSRPSGLHQPWGTRQRRGASCSSSTSTASPWPGRWWNSSTPRGNLACASVFLVEPTGLHHAGDDLAIVFIVSSLAPPSSSSSPRVCTTPATTLSSAPSRPPVGVHDQRRRLPHGHLHHAHDAGFTVPRATDVVTIEHLGVDPMAPILLAGNSG
ncbi:hypothetical protein PVAP13_7KG300401 [Panicum virgatum]|uniref:Uncharacterized protein n=1 Tax=Panicum virgatum TaxID=38727 RepID=A0A8T0QLR7_PANVG|nr:hypothetical protein PVAP13_7KG300401 [Panicum virgatum]